MRGRFVRTSHLAAHQRDVVVERRVLRIDAKPHLMTGDLVERLLRPDRVVENAQIGLAPREHLQPEIPHLVGRALAPERLTRRQHGIARIRGGIVIGIPHRHRRPPRQREGRHVAIDVLPPEIPVLDGDQRLGRSVGERGRSGHFARPLVRVRLHRLHFDVHRQHERIGFNIVCVAWRDVDVLAAEPQHRRRALGRLAPEEQTDRRVQRFRLPRRHQVQFDDEIGAGAETPGEPFRQQRRDLARRPAEKMSVGIHG